eukprot:scaffold172_cov254-Pinguiococcus_pyrenoidosus.AAC.32
MQRHRLRFRRRHGGCPWGRDELTIDRHTNPHRASKAPRARTEQLCGANEVRCYLRLIEDTLQIRDSGEVYAGQRESGGAGGSAGKRRQALHDWLRYEAESLSSAQVDEAVKGDLDVRGDRALHRGPPSDKVSFRTTGHGSHGRIDLVNIWPVREGQKLPAGCEVEAVVRSFYRDDARRCSFRRAAHYLLAAHEISGDHDVAKRASKTLAPPEARAHHCNGLPRSDNNDPLGETVYKEGRDVFKGRRRRRVLETIQGHRERHGPFQSRRRHTAKSSS